jgi:hypothetical protein
LAGIYENFQYDFVSSTEHESVRFEFTSKNIDKLSEILFMLTELFGINDAEDESSDWSMLEGFADYVESGRIIAVCTDFIEDYQQLLKESEEEE